MTRDEEADYRRRVVCEAFAAGVAYASRESDPTTTAKILEIVGDRATTHNQELFDALAADDETQRNANARHWRTRQRISKDAGGLLDAILERLRVFSLAELKRRYRAILGRSWELEYQEANHAKLMGTMRKVNDA